MTARFLAGFWGDQSGASGPAYVIILVIVGSALGFAVFALVGRFKRNKEASARISRRLGIGIGDAKPLAHPGAMNGSPYRPPCWPEPLRGGFR